MCITSRSSVAISTYSMVTLRTALAMAAHLRTKVSPGARCLSAWAAATWAFVVAINLPLPGVPKFGYTPHRSAERDSLNFLTKLWVVHSERARCVYSTQVTRTETVPAGDNRLRHGL
jgi:hypothetical protein